MMKTPQFLVAFTIVLFAQILHAQETSSLDINFGINQSFRTIFGEDKYDFIRDLRNENEKLSTRVSAEILYSFSITKRSHFSAGIAYREFGYVISDEKEARWGSE